MKSSIKFLAIIALFFTFNFAAHAQRGGGPSLNPEQMAEKETTRLVEELTLDEAQAAKVKEINLAYAKKMQEARDDNKGNRDAMKEIVASIHTEKSAEMKMILSEAQFKTFEEIQAKQAGRKKGRGGKGGSRS